MWAFNRHQRRPKRPKSVAGIPPWNLADNIVTQPLADQPDPTAGALSVGNAASPTAFTSSS